MKKKIAALSMAACMVASVTACGGSKPAETTAAATGAETTAAGVSSRREQRRGDKGSS